MQVNSFRPTINGSQTLSVADVSSQSAKLAAGTEVEINNENSVINVFVEQDPIANNPVAVLGTSYPVRAGQCKVIRLFPGVTKLAFIGDAAGPSAIIISPGEGI